MREIVRLSALALCLCLLLAGCGTDAPFAEDAATTTTTAGTSTPTQAFPISKAEALELVQQHLGIYNGDRDPKTGFRMSWILEESPTAEKPLYVFILQEWNETEGEPSHASTINWLSVDAYTGTIIA